MSMIKYSCCSYNINKTQKEVLRIMNKMKKILAVAAAAAITVSAASCGNKSDVKKVEDNGTMKIGYTVVEPLNYPDESGELTGFETEFAKAVCDKIGVKPEFVKIDWDAKEAELKSGTIDCVWNGMTITPELKENISISDPYLLNRQVLVVRADDEAKYTESIEGAKVVAENGSAGARLAETFENVTFTGVADQATTLMEVKSGTADVAVIDYVMAAYSVGEGTSYADLMFIDKGFEKEEYGIGFRKDSDLTEKVNNAIKELAADGTLNEIATKYGLEDLLLVK